MSWQVEFTDEFEAWWNSLTNDQQDDVTYSVGLLEEVGPSLGFPHSSKINGSRHNGMRELRTQSAAGLYEPFTCLIPGGRRYFSSEATRQETTGGTHEFVPMADRMYDEYLDQLKREGRL